MALRAFTRSPMVEPPGITISLSSSSLISMSDAGVTTVSPSEKGAGWETSYDSFMDMLRLPWETATVEILTFSPMTTVPVFSLTIILAAVSGTTSEEGAIIEGHVRALVDEGTSGRDYFKAQDELKAKGKAAIPFLLNELVDRCDLLTRENHALKQLQSSWTTERAKLIEKNELAKSKVESMISRLKSLEQDS